MFQEPTYSVWILGSIAGAVTRMNLLGWTIGTGVPLQWRTHPCLAALIVLQVLLFFGRLHISSSAILIQGVVVFWNGPDSLPKEEGNLTSGLPPCPVL